MLDCSSCTDNQALKSTGLEDMSHQAEPGCDCASDAMSHGNMQLQIAQVVKNGIGAMTFGVQLPHGRLSFPTAPTWMLYTGNDTRCLHNIPILIERQCFCRVFPAEARVFPTYTSWLLSMMLAQVTAASR